MLDSSKIKQGEWDKYQLNQKRFARLQEIIEELDDITHSLNGWGENPYTDPREITVELDHPESTKKNKIAPIEFPCVIQVLEKCSFALNDFACLRYQNENLRIVGALK